MARRADRDPLRRRDARRSARPDGPIDIVAGQLAGSIPDGATAGELIVAYEPVWAIGTGLTATPDDIVAMHAAIRAAPDGR